MGCGASSQSDVGAPRRRPGSVGDVVVFLPGLRVPRAVDFAQALGGTLDRSIVERLSALRSRVVEMAMQESAAALKPRRRTAARHGSSTASLLQALEDYLPVLLGLAKEGSMLRHKVQFTWTNQEDNAEETAMSDAWYEVLSVLHLMAMVCFLQANTLLLPRSYGDGYAPRVSEESRRATVDVFLKAAGYLDCAIRHVIPKMALELRRQLPVDLAEGNLKALSLQALGQGVDMQLGLAIDSPKATLAVKRRLACEMVKYWQQVQETIPELPVSDGWGKKHRLFIKWKYVEAKIASEGLKHRVFEVSLADLQADEDQAYRKIRLRAEDVQGRNVLTNFWGMNFTTDKLRSLVKKWQTLIEAHVDVKTTDNYMLRLFCIGFTKRRPNQVKRTCYAQASQIRQIRRKMVEIMVNQASTCDLKELVSKFIPEVIGKEIEKSTSSIFPLQNVFIRKVKILKAPKFDLGKLMEVHGDYKEDVGVKLERPAEGDEAGQEEVAAAVE